MEKKTIMLISQSLTGGGAEKVVANLSIALSEEYHVVLITFEKNEKEFDFRGERIDLNIPGGRFSIAKKLHNFIGRCIKIYKLKKLLLPIASISFVPQTDLVNIFTRKKGCRCVIEVSSNSSVAFSSKFSKIYRKYMLNAADRVVCVSEGVRQDIVSKFGINNKKTRTIYNSVDLENIKRKMLESCPKCITTHKNIVCIGSFRYPKGHWHLIKAFSYISDKIPDYTLVLLGDGEYRSQYNRLIDNLKIDHKRIVMPGFIDNPYPILANSDLFVFSSIYEGFGNVIIEAMACSVPVLSVDCKYGPREILYPSINKNQCISSITKAPFGWLLPAFDDSDISTSVIITENEKLMGEAILRILFDPNERNRMSDNGLCRCQDFGNEVFKSEWEKCLNEIR